MSRRAECRARSSAGRPSRIHLSVRQDLKDFAGWMDPAYDQRCEVSGEGKVISGIPRSLKALLLLFTQLFAAYWGIRAFEGRWTVVELLLGAVLGYAYLDLMTVLTHFTIDNYFSPRTPIIGSVVHYYRVHHLMPDRMFERG